MKAHWLLWFFSALAVVASGCKDRAIKHAQERTHAKYATAHTVNTHTHTHIVTLAIGSCLTQLTTHTFKQGQELKVIVNQRDMRERW